MNLQPIQIPRESMEINLKKKNIKDILKYMSFSEIMHLFSELQIPEKISISECEKKIIGNRHCILVNWIILKNGQYYHLNQKFYKSSGTSRGVGTSNESLEGIWLPFESYDEFDNRLYKSEDIIIIKIDNDTYDYEEINRIYPILMKNGRYINEAIATAGKFLHENNI